MKYLWISFLWTINACNSQAVTDEPLATINHDTTALSNTTPFQSSSSGDVISLEVDKNSEIPAKGTGETYRSEYGNTKLIAYFPSYRNLNQVDFKKLTHICWSFANPNSEYSFTTSTDMKAMVTKALENKVKPMLSVGGGGLSQSYQDNWTAGMNIINRHTLADSLVAFTLRQNFSGIDLDLEGEVITPDFNDFVLVLSQKAKENQLLLSAAFAKWKGPSISDSILNVLDWINLMAYDQSGPWASSSKLHHSPLSFAESNIEYWQSNRNVAKNKIVLGLPFYGFDLEYVGSNDYVSSYLSYSEIARKWPDSLHSDKIGSLTFNGTQTIANKTRLALEYGGVMIWEIGQDATGELSLLNVIARNMKK